MGYMGLPLAQGLSKTGANLTSVSKEGKNGSS